MLQKSSNASDLQRYYQPKTALNRVLLEAPYFPRCSSDKTAAISQPIQFALRFPYMQVNRKGMVSWLIFDLDHNDPLIYEKVGLPPPNLAVINRQNNHSHLFYAIPTVCTTDKARSKPIQYMKAIYEGMATALNADPSYRGPVAKTPNHPWWKTWEIHSQTYSLDELADYIDLPERRPWSKGPNLAAVSHSRHCMLFEETRFYAYSIVNREREKGSYERFLSVVKSYAFNKNNYRHRGFAANLTDAQVKATVKSICRWTWDHYVGDAKCNRGVMGLSISNDLKQEDKQKLSAQRTHSIRKRNTENRVRSAVNQLIAKGITLKNATQTLLAVHSGLSRQTIAKYMDVVHDVFNTASANKPTLINLFGRKKPTDGLVLGNGKNVNYGVHQITTAVEDSSTGSGSLCTSQQHYNVKKDQEGLRLNTERSSLKKIKKNKLL